LIPGRVILVLVALALCLGGAAARTPDKLTDPELGNVLYCLDTKLNAIGYPPPRFEGNSFRVRYALGIVDKNEDKKNELHLVVYGKGEKRAILYEVYFDHDGRPSIYIGEVGTLKQEKGVMEPDEIWGGVGSYYKVKRLLRVVSAKPAITIPASEVVAGSRVCIFER
jgi:hypothetical protein